MGAQMLSFRAQGGHSRDSGRDPDKSGQAARVTLDARASAVGTPSYNVFCLLTPDLRFPAALDVDLQALDFLIEGGKGDLEALGGIGLAPIGARQHIENDLALASFHDLKKRLPGGVPGGMARAIVGAVLKNLFRQEIRPQRCSRGKDHGSLHGVFQLTHVTRPVIVH